MTNETRNRIEAYKKALPEMKERVVAAAFLMVMSVVMMASASFAWLTISRRPEVTGVSTSVAANGNLEIALATSTTAPGESQVGDSSASKGQSITASNITWGNLVNLSDPSYGLDNLTLRPAQLNQSSLMTSPLYGAVYQVDGRVDKLDSSFAYSVWNTDTKVFEVPTISNVVGVRAISSTKLGEVESGSTALKVHDKRKETEEANLAAGSAYTAITNNKDWMNSLAVVMGTYMTAKMNAGQGNTDLTNPTIEKEDVKNLTELFGAFVEVYDLQFEAMAKMVNYQLFLMNDAGDKPYTEKDVTYIKGATEASLKNDGLRVSGLNQAKIDYPKLVDGYTKLQALNEDGVVKWEDSGLNAIVNSLMNVGTCTLDGTPINNIGASNASGYLDGKVHTALITNGVLYNLEKMNGTRCDVRNMTVSATVQRYGIAIPASISVNIATNAPVPSQFSTDLDYADNKYPTTKIAEVAQDTYGLAVDLWVRTNASGSYLTLEGNILTKSEMIRSTGKDLNGSKVELYTLERSSEETAEDGTKETVTYTLDLYQIVSKDQDGNDVVTWYDASSHDKVTINAGETPNAKMEELITVIGYEGENRVWEEANAWEQNSQLSLDSTTQGSGSCYVYYADSPEDQARSLKLLESMNVAFVDDTGKLLATAIMDTERFYAENGRVTVPLVLKNDSLNIGRDSFGNDIYVITPLTQNEAMRITAIVYLDGTKLSNQDVLAASDIQGQLNIQFGSNVTLSHAEDETLFNATRSVSAAVDKSNFKYDESLENGIPMTTNVTLTIEGDKPTEVKAFFIRAISSTQGSREEVMNFVQQADGTWKAAYTFKAPGNYILRSVELDGQTYDLKTCPEVIVEGFTVESLNCIQAENRHISIMTAAASSSVDLKLKFASNKAEAMPKTVQGRFLRNIDGTAVNIDFSYNSGGPDQGYWTGQATFISSGEYTLEYLLLDGEYNHLDEGLIQSATVYLGMKTAIYTDSPIEFKYVPSELADNQKNLYMKVKIMDNTGAVMEGLQDARLYYTMEGSSILANGYSAKLIWDAGTGYYKGTFLNSKVGVFKFNSVMVGSNTITYASDSPVFRIMSPNPPSLKNVGDSNAQETVYCPDNNATMHATFDYSSTSKIMALVRKDLKDKDGKVTSSKKYYIIGEAPSTSGDSTTWTFNLPNVEAQDGYWTMEQLYVWDYYTKDGKYINTTLKKQDDTDWDYKTQKWIVQSELKFTDENTCMREDVTGEDYWMKIIKTVTVKFTEDKSENFTGNNFLTPYTVSGLSVDFVDFQGMKVVDSNDRVLVSDVQLILEYVNGTASTYGFYNNPNLTNTTEGATVTVDLSADATGTHFVQTSDAQLLFAGKYKTTLKYKILGNNNEQFVEASDPAKRPLTNMPIFTVSSNMPYVKFTATSPAVGTKFDVAYTKNPTGESDIKQLANEISPDGDSVTCYYTAKNDGCDCNGYDAPKATVGLYNMGEAFDSATCTINTKGTASNVTYQFSADKLFNEQTLGKNGENRVYLGTNAEATQLIVTAGGQEYTFTLEKPLKATLEY